MAAGYKDPLFARADKAQQMSDDPKKRFLSPQAKRAAIETRRRLKVQYPTGELRRSPYNTQFGWEISKFGNFVLSRSETGFGTQLLAQEAGEKALQIMLPTDS